MILVLPVPSSPMIRTLNKYSWPSLLPAPDACKHQVHSKSQYNLFIFDCYRYRFGVIAAYCSNMLQRGHFDSKFQVEGVALPPINIVRIVRPINALQLCPWQFSHRCYGWGATSENRSKIGDFAPTQSLWLKISGRRGHPHQSFLHG